jgi:ABC-type dipeptide/oligopeptide/nickel transport system permease component
VTFTLAKALPGDPVYSMVGERSNPETIEKIRREIGADRSIIGQYWGYISLLLRGEMGRSYYTNRRVLDDILVKVPNTFKLALMAMLIAVPSGILLGLLSGLTGNGAIDRGVSAISILGLSMPVFWSGLMLMFFLSLRFKLLPPSGTGGLRYLLLPALTLSLPALSTLSRITRVSVLEIRDMPFIQTARAKGIRDMRITMVHIFRNAVIPIITVAGLEFGSYLSGAVLTETIFGWDGIGRFAMEGIIKRDYPVIMGCILITTLSFVVINLAVDIAYHFLDPRMRIHGTDN